MLPLVIVNPKSAAGATEKRWAAMASDLRTHFGAFECVMTRRSGEAREIARREALNGRAFIIACGGDGTINEVANGILESACEAELGILPSGTGGDFRRTLGISNRASLAAQTLRTGATRRMDVGRVSFTNHENEPESRYFLGVSSSGLAGKVLQQVKQQSSAWLPAPAAKLLGGKISFAVAALSSVMQFEKPTLVYEIENLPPPQTATARRSTVISFCVCNARYFGGGMNIAPNALIDDGQLDLVVIGDIERARIITNIHKLYSGTHLNLEGVQHALIKGLSVRAAESDARVTLETDGELVGYLPAKYEIVPQALRVRCST